MVMNRLPKISWASLMIRREVSKSSFSATAESAEA